MIFIITILLLAADFYYLKNIAGRRLVGLRWWNEVDPATGDSKWVFESSEPGTKVVNATDSRFFWLAMYVQPALWVAMAIIAIARFHLLWLPLVCKSIMRIYVEICCFANAAFDSHRFGPYDYEHPRLFPMRQIQPGFQSCWLSARHDQLGRQHC